MLNSWPFAISNRADVGLVQKVLLENLAVDPVQLFEFFLFWLWRIEILERIAGRRHVGDIRRVVGNKLFDRMRHVGVDLANTTLVAQVGVNAVLGRVRNGHFVAVSLDVIAIDKGGIWIQQLELRYHGGQLRVLDPIKVGGRKAGDVLDHALEVSQAVFLVFGLVGGSELDISRQNVLLEVMHLFGHLKRFWIRIRYKPVNTNTHLLIKVYGWRLLHRHTTAFEGRAEDITPLALQGCNLSFQ